MECGSQSSFVGSKNPYKDASFLSKLSFWYTLDLFRRGSKKHLNQDDFYRPLKSDLSRVLGDRLEKNWTKQINEKTNPSLIKVIVKTFWKELIFLGLLQFFNDIIIRLFQPFFLGLLLNYFAPNSDITKREAYLYAIAVVALNFLASISINQFMFRSLSIGMKIRVAASSLIYRKSLRISSKALKQTSVGNIVNLLFNDMSRFDTCSFFINCIWLAPLLTIMVAILLYCEVGYAGLIGVTVVMISTTFQSFVSKFSSKFRLETALKTDKRVSLISEVISGIQAIKFYVWEKPFSKMVQNFRDEELRVIRRSSFFRVVYLTFNLFTIRCAILCTILSIMILDEELTAPKIFKITLYLGMISMVMSQMFVRGITEIFETFVSIDKLQTFLKYEEKEDSYSKTTISSQKTVFLSMKNLSCHWKNETINDEFTLNDISLKVKQGELIGIVGPVGSGKSSLLKVILGELQHYSGFLKVSKKISYASQDPWIFSGSIRQNILFGSLEFDMKRYKKVIKACALRKDLKTFECGDQTIIGEQGSTLSGGQKARISLARALYRKADLYLLDDPLSAVDFNVGKHIFDQCLSDKGFLGRQEVATILVTHQVHFLQNADWIVVMKNGSIERQEKLENITNSGITISKLVKELEKKEELKQSPSSVSTSKSSEESNFKTNYTQESTKELKIKTQGNSLWKYLKSSRNSFLILVTIILFVLTQTMTSISDYWVGYCTKQIELKKFSISYQSENSTTDNFDERSLAFSSENMVYVCVVLIFTLLFIATIRSILFYTITLNASKNLHAGAFNGIISTKLRFFDLNPSGRILNRFSKDFSLIDELLPKSLLDAIQVLLASIGAIIITAITNPTILIPIFFLGICLRFIQNYYLETSLDIKRQERISKSQIFVHLSATIRGLTTVRAFGSQKVLVKEFDKHLDAHTGTHFTYLSCSQAFGFALDTICMLFVFLVILSFLLFEKKELNGSSVGLAITQSMSLTTWLQLGVRQSAEVSSQMMSLERILEYQNLEPEEKGLKKSVNKNWPEKGDISFKNVSFKYSDDNEVLKGLNFSVKSLEKIGIVGRTGAGKSSLVGSLLRIANTEGKIEIDAIDTSQIDLSQLRSKISIIPQDPFLFSSSVRKNLDPFEEYSNEALWKSLKAAHLDEFTALKPMGLETLVAAGGSNFSVGQRQLICLARAILRGNKILILDEATANVDQETDELIQRTIRERFNECTVLTIAHRLQTVMSSDKILLIDSGKLCAFDSPSNLLKENRIFSKMVKAAEAHESVKLKVTRRKKNK